MDHTQEINPKIYILTLIPIEKGRLLINVCV